MDLHFFEPDELPRPPAETRIESADITPYPDGRRVRVAILLTAFSQRPSLDILVLDPAGETVAMLAVIEAIHRKMDFTLHLRGAAAGPGYNLRLALFYAPPIEEKQKGVPDEVVHRLDVPFELPAAPEEADDDGR